VVTRAVFWKKCRLSMICLLGLESGPLKHGGPLEQIIGMKSQNCFHGMGKRTGENP
jgi:hypothetical protein